MNINYKQPQFELFPGSSAASVDDAGRSKVFLANLTLSVENLVVLSILGIMVAVFAYSLGVERGKHVMALEFKRPLATQSVAIPVIKTPAAHLPQGATVGMSAVRQNIGVTQPSGSSSTVASANIKPAAVPAVLVVQQKPLNPVVAAFKYTIQVASYADEKFAHKAAIDLNKNGFETLVMQKGKYAILCVGKFSQKNEASAIISKLKSKYKDCLVRSM